MTADPADEGSNVVDDAHFTDAGDDHEETRQQEDRIVVDSPEGADGSLSFPGTDQIVDDRYERERTAYCAVRHIRLILDEGCRDQKDNDQDQHEGGDIVFHFRELVRVHGSLLVSEEKHQNRNRAQGTKLDCPEDARPAIHEEETGEIHVSVGAKHDRGRIADQGRGSLQIGGDRYAAGYHQR